MIRLGVGDTVRVLAGRVVSLLVQTLGIVLLLGGAVWLEDRATGAPSPRLVWAIAVCSGAIYVGVGLFRPVARLTVHHRPHPVGVLTAWLAAAAGWAVLAVAAGLALQLVGVLDGAHGAAGWLDAGWVLMALVLACTLGAWSLTRIWGWPVGVIVLAAVVFAGALVVAVVATVLTLAGSPGWWSWLLSVSPAVTLPGLTWLAHRPMGHLAVSARPESDGPL